MDIFEYIFFVFLASFNHLCIHGYFYNCCRYILENNVDNLQLSFIDEEFTIDGKLIQVKESLILTEILSLA